MIELRLIDGDAGDSWLCRLEEPLEKAIRGKTTPPWNPLDTVMDAMRIWFDDQQHAIVEGEGAVTVVLTFTNGQSVAVPLKLRDATLMSKFVLEKATVGGGRVLVKSEDEATRSCRKLGHAVNAVSAFLENQFPTGVCSRCGEKVEYALTNRGRFHQDLGAMYGRQVADTVIEGHLSVSSSLEDLGSVRALLEARQQEITESLEWLRLAEMVLASRMRLELEKAG